MVPGSLHIPRTVLEWRLDPDSAWRTPHVGGLDQEHPPALRPRLLVGARRGDARRSRVQPCGRRDRRVRGLAGGGAARRCAPTTMRSLPASVWACGHRSASADATRRSGAAATRSAPGARSRAERTSSPASGCVELLGVAAAVPDGGGDRAGRRGIADRPRPCGSRRPPTRLGASTAPARARRRACARSRARPCRRRRRVSRPVYMQASVTSSGRRRRGVVERRNRDADLEQSRVWMRSCSIVLTVHSETRAAGVTSVTACPSPTRSSASDAAHGSSGRRRRPRPVRRRGRAPARRSSGVSTCDVVARAGAPAGASGPTPSRRQRAPVATATWSKSYAEDLVGREPALEGELDVRRAARAGPCGSRRPGSTLRARAAAPRARPARRACGAPRRARPRSRGCPSGHRGLEPRGAGADDEHLCVGASSAGCARDASRGATPRPCVGFWVQRIGDDRGVAGDADVAADALADVLVAALLDLHAAGTGRRSTGGPRR